MSTVNILSTIIAVVFGIGALICWIISIFTYKEIKSKILGTQEVVLSMQAGTCVLSIGALLIILVQVLAG